MRNVINSDKQTNALKSAVLMKARKKRKASPLTLSLK